MVKAQILSFALFATSIAAPWGINAVKADNGETHHDKRWGINAVKADNGETHHDKRWGINAVKADKEGTCTIKARVFPINHKMFKSLILSFALIAGSLAAAHPNAEGNTPSKPVALQGWRGCRQVGRCTFCCDGYGDCDDCCPNKDGTYDC
ncbi:hypothetical protein HDV06_005347 [Boothiomyces sp. JEL0866]|nr:hypothetical protein HDV06_005347 [Boothiomyces sp. JEL0866]